MVQLEVRPSVRTEGSRDVARVKRLVLLAMFCVAVCASVSVAGFTPGPLALVTGAVCLAAFGQFTRWPMAVAASVLTLLLVVGLGMQAFPALDLPLAVADALLLASLSLVALTVIWTRRGSLRLPGREQIVFAATCLVVPVVALSATLLIELRHHGSKVAWVMSNDSTFNVMMARYIVADGGHDASKHMNVAPLTSEFAAAFLAPGRAALAPAQLMEHDVRRVIEMLLLMLAVMSVVGSVIVAQTVPARYPAIRAFLAVGAGLLPWTWFLGGYAIGYGFWNAVVAGVALVATWLGWLEARRAPVFGSAIQACAAAVFVTVWVPLVLIPAAFGLVLTLRFWKQHLGMRRGRLLSWLLPVAAFFYFAYVLTKPTVAAPTTPGAGSPMSALAFDGAFFAFPHSTPGVIGLLTFGVVLLGSSIARDRWPLLGVVIVAALGVLGLHYLMSQRATAPTGPWGYYPQKFAWLLCLLAPYMVGRAIAGVLRGAVQLSTSARLGVGLAALLVATAVVVQVPPADNRPPSSEGNPGPRPAPDYRATSMFFLWSVAQRHAASDFDPAARRMFRWSSPEDKIIVSGWYHDGSLDGFMNFWLLQQTLGTGHPEVRAFAYNLDSGDAASLCAVVDTWGGGVTIKTRRAGLERRMMAACPSSDFRVDLTRGGLVPTPS